MNKYLRNWDAMRVIRLVAGVGFGVYAVTSTEYLFLIFAGVFILQAAFNLSCCGAAGCYPSQNVEKQQEVYKGEIKKYKG